MSPHVSTNDLRHATVENAPGPQAGINGLALPALRASSSASAPPGQARRSVSAVGRARGSVSYVSRRRTRVSTLTRETRLEGVRTGSDLSFAIGSSSAVTPGRGPYIHPTHAPDREFVPGVVCPR